MPDRRTEITKYIDPHGRGIEVGPWYSPIFPKAKGFDCLALDAFDAEYLRGQAWLVPGITAEMVDRIEKVDLKGSATMIAELVGDAIGTFDYIVSSHSFEHLPNPIGFLQSVEKVLKPGGMLSMAIPDRRASFDYFRPHVTLADWLQAFHEKADKPTLRQIFAHKLAYAIHRSPTADLAAFSLDVNPATVIPIETLRASFDEWDELRKNPGYEYRDAHCSIFTPSSFHLLISDAKYLGLTAFTVIEVSETNGPEFYAHLRNEPTKTETDRTFYDNRRALLHRINDECSIASKRTYELERRIQRLEVENAKIKGVS